jgi:hypothetical protein
MGSDGVAVDIGVGLGVRLGSIVGVGPAGAEEQSY